MNIFAKFLLHVKFRCQHVIQSDARGEIFTYNHILHRPNNNNNIDKMRAYRNKGQRYFCLVVLRRNPTKVAQEKNALEQMLMVIVILQIIQIMDTATENVIFKHVPQYNLHNNNRQKKSYVKII